MTIRIKDIGSTLEVLGLDALRLSKGLVEVAEAEALRRMSGSGTIEITARFVHTIIEARLLRADRFGPILTPEPGWTLMLLLYAARLDGRRLTPARLAEAGIPIATVVGRVAALEARGLVTRAPNPARRRGRLVTLTDGAARRMHDYLRAAREI
jgi:DNA-binding MarR family transcriptional regulator